MPARAAQTALVLSAGGVRGAYQVGVIAGLVDILGREPGGAPIFDIFSASSVGALNAAYLAAHADRNDHGIDGLIEIWTALDFDQLFRFSWLGVWGWPRVRMPGNYEPDRVARYIGRAIYDPRPVEKFLARVIDWDRLHANIRGEVVRALAIAALDICDGSTMVFTELAQGVTMRPYPYLTDPTMFTVIDAEHVMAATALPFIFPARRVLDRYYMDGAIRFETPIVPALRAGARRVVTISLLDEPTTTDMRRELVFPGVFFLIGQLLNAVLLSPLLNDLDRLQRNNRMIEVLAETLEPATTAEVIINLETEVPPGRIVPTLAFRPSESIEAITSEFLDDELRRGKPLRRAILRRLADFETGQALLSSFLFFDGRLAARLIELGRRDALADRDRILAFFDA